MAKDINRERLEDSDVDAWASNYAVVFSTQRGYQKGERFVELRMQTLKNIDDHLESQPVEKWHVLAKIFNDRIETWPVHADPFYVLYLAPTHEIINCIRYCPPKPFASILPQNPEEAVSLIEWCSTPSYLICATKALA
ncbi:hypothetical protein HBO01_06080 [Pseudomonas rhodesiae]|uniref:hypothetical protein n=1 Tax=Pseudomonas rhodesiae TaxID=76760 RepID=UPI0014759CED|nr:hypothetical protein [Pseudomonas rhodesiae]NMY78240.1 hypothetical protein [Pseudomonas rhodesiae]